MSSNAKASTPQLIVRDHEFDQAYGERVHLLDSPTLQTLLARIGSPGVRHPELAMMLRTVYSELFLRAIDGELETCYAEMPTRMVESHPRRGIWRGEAFDPSERLVFVDVIRAGIVPAQQCFELASSLFVDANLRLDHLNMARISDAEGRVMGVDLSGSKVGGSVEGRVLIVPDPMGATGSTLQRALEHYLAEYGRPKKIIALPMIATPEYLKAVLQVEDLVVYTARLDRGMSPEDVLMTPPGVRWDEESGLNEQGYIIPGAGGIGEVLNNAWC